MRSSPALKGRGLLNGPLQGPSNSPRPRLFSSLAIRFLVRTHSPGNSFLLFALSRSTTRERTMASQNECPTIEEMISDEVRRQFGTRTFQAYEKRPETEGTRPPAFPETSHHFETRNLSSRRALKCSAPPTNRVSPQKHGRLRAAFSSRPRSDRRSPRFRIDVRFPGNCRSTRLASSTL